MTTEYKSKAGVTAVDGKVVIALPGVDGYIKTSPQGAKNLALELLRNAEIAEGKEPSHLFVIPVKP